MIKKFYIIGLILTFLFSTTGYSISMHICEMMEEASSSECGMCAETEIPETMPCCPDDSFAGEIITSGNYSDCCEIQLVNNKVEDDFLYFKEQVMKEFTSSFVELPLSIILVANQTMKSHSPFAFDSSPPWRGNDIYIYNSVLII